MDAADRFVNLLTSAGDPPLDESLLALAAARPGATATPAEGLTRLDDLAAGCPGPSLDDLLAHLFVTEGFRGDRDDYHDPRNSYLDEVLGRRTGMPITLAAVLITVGRRLDLELVGIGMPGHFLVREADDPEGFVDPFHAGVRIGTSACAARFRTLHGPRAAFHPSYLRPVSNRAIVERVVANLTASYRARSPRRLDWLLDLRLRIPVAPHDRRAMADLCELRGRYAAAAEMLEAIPTDLDEGAADRARRLRARLN